jgi:hypothetical protein
MNCGVNCNELTHWIDPMADVLDVLDMLCDILMLDTLLLFFG